MSNFNLPPSGPNQGNTTPIFQALQGPQIGRPAPQQSPAPQLNNWVQCRTPGTMVGVFSVNPATPTPGHVHYEAKVRNSILGLERVIPFSIPSSQRSQADQQRVILENIRRLAGTDPVDRARVSDWDPAATEPAYSRTIQTAIAELAHNIQHGVNPPTQIVSGLTQRPNLVAATGPSGQVGFGRPGFVEALNHAIAASGILPQNISVNGQTVATNPIAELVTFEDIFRGRCDVTLRRPNAATQWDSMRLSMAPDGRVQVALSSSGGAFAKVDRTRPTEITFRVATTALTGLLDEYNRQATSAVDTLSNRNGPAGLIGFLAREGMATGLSNVRLQSPNFAGIVFDAPLMRRVVIDNPGALLIRGNFIAEGFTLTGKGAVLFDCENARMKAFEVGKQIVMGGRLGGLVYASACKISGDGGAGRAGAGVDMRKIRFVPTEGEGTTTCADWRRVADGYETPKASAISALRVRCGFGPPGVHNDWNVLSGKDKTAAFVRRGRVELLNEILPPTDPNFDSFMKNLARFALFSAAPTQNQNVWEDVSAGISGRAQHLVEHQFGTEQDDAYVSFGCDQAAGLLRVSYSESGQVHPWSDIRAEHGLLDLGEYVLNVRDRNRIAREQAAQQQARAAAQARAQRAAQAQGGVRP